MASARSRLLAWYGRERRALPWRGSLDPWAILVSEVMLQQTQAGRVVEFYERFMQRFPGPGELAAAAEAEVLGAWSGLGYYGRARRLQATARAVVARGGRLPSTAAALAELPGVGPYTAAAVASIAFGEPAPVLDGNVARVLGRRLGLVVPVGRAEARRTLLAAVEELLGDDSGTVNQALMELGALRCRPRRPACGGCPFELDCRAHASGEPERFPPRLPSSPPRRERLTVAVVERGGRVLFFRRSTAESLLAGLWELPSVVEARVEAIAEGLAVRYGGMWQLLAPCGTARHAMSGRALTLSVWDASWSGSEGVAEGPEAGWFARAELATLPVGSMVGKALAIARRRTG